MDFTLFGFLDGISPLWWLALGILLAGLEMVTVSFFLIWPGLAAATIAVLLWLLPGLGGNAQVGLFAVLAVGYTFAGRGLFRVRGQPESEAPGLNRRAVQFVGRQAVVIETRAGGEARVEIDGIPWSARFDGEAAPAGSRVRVTGSDGLVLIVTAEAG
jgi:hypothetical protein